MYRLLDYNKDKFTTDVYKDSSKGITWKNAPGIDFLIIQFSMDRMIDLEELCGFMNQKIIDCRKEYLEIEENVWVRYMTAIEKAQMRERINKRGYRYMVLSAETSGDNVLIYKPNPDSQASSMCDVPLQMDITIRNMLKKRLFSREREEYQVITFESDLDDNYVDGDIYYIVDIGDEEVMEFPITREMIEYKRIYIKGKKPEIKFGKRIVCNIKED